jgi:anaerobic carbon-monoxide dehydrogenase catalytic subunit
MCTRPDHRSVDPAAAAMLKISDREGFDTAWSRLEAQQPQCGYGLLGTCCRNCSHGSLPHRPLGEGPNRGVCGATADTIVARNLARMAAAGALCSFGSWAQSSFTAQRGRLEGRNTEYNIINPEKLFGSRPTRHPDRWTGNPGHCGRCRRPGFGLLRRPGGRRHPLCRGAICRRSVWSC